MTWSSQGRKYSENLECMVCVGALRDRAGEGMQWALLGGDRRGHGNRHGGYLKDSRRGESGTQSREI